MFTDSAKYAIGAGATLIIAIVCILLIKYNVISKDAILKILMPIINIFLRGLIDDSQIIEIGDTITNLVAGV